MSGKEEYYKKLIEAKKERAKTVYNPANALYNKLTKFFSGPVVKFKTPELANANRFSYSKHEWKDSFHTPFKRTEEYYLINEAQVEQDQETARMERYVDLENMELSPPEIKVALDIYADEIACYTEFSPILQIICPKDEIKEQLRSLYYDTLNIPMNLFRWVRAMCSKGDFFLFLDIDPKLGVTGTRALPTMAIQRLEGEDPTNPNYVQFQWNDKGITFENVEIAHFRILGNDKYYPYGTSVLDASRKITKQLNLMIEHMMTYRIVRSSEKRAFYYDIGGMDSTQQETYLEKAISKTKRQSVINASNGQLDLRYNVVGVEEDYHIPTRKGSETRIEPLPGGQFVGDIEDVEFLRDQLFTSLKIPGSYLTNKNADGEQNSLAQKSMLFAKEIQRIQHSVVAELVKIGRVHLITLGYSGKDILSFEIRLNNPSKLAEMQEFEHLKLQAEAASLLSDHNISKRWIQSRIFKFSPDEIRQNVYEILGDAKFQAILSNIENQVAGGGVPGMDGSGMAGGLGSSGGSIPGLDQMMGGEGGQPEANPEDEFVQLGTEGGDMMPPGEQGRRTGEDGKFLTPNSLRPYKTEGSRGKAHSKSTADNRNQRLNQMNAVTGRNLVRANHKAMAHGYDYLLAGLFPDLSMESIENNEQMLEEEHIITSAEKSLVESLTLIEKVEDQREARRALLSKTLANYNQKEVVNKVINDRKERIKTHIKNIRFTSGEQNDNES